MYDINSIRKEPENFRAALLRRNLDEGAAESLLARVCDLDDTRRKSISRAQLLQERRNAASQEIGAALKAKNNGYAATLKQEVAELKIAMAAAGYDEKVAIAALETELSAIPNHPLPEVPQGADEADNVEVRLVGERPVFSFNPKEHFEIGADLGQMDFEAAARMSGARFCVLKGNLARLERALSQFMLDLHIDEHGYQEVAPPLLVRDQAMFGTAQLPKFENDQFIAIRNDEGAARFWLIPTAEVPLTNLVREQIIEEGALPMRMVAATPCFRAEAGSAGKDTRGLIRQHQFTKVEMVSITIPEQAREEHERMTRHAEEVLKRLGLSYRVVLLCTGDMGFAARKTYDIEVWMPGQGRYREISSCSVCGDFQARRMNVRYRPKNGGDTRFVHTLNGSGVAVGRALAAVIENFQNEDGSVTIPEVLRPYMGGIEIIK